MTAPTEQEREVLREFIQVYRENPCLWDMNSDLYKNKEMKHAAWGVLTQVLKKIDPDANICTTKKKVDNLRSVYFRELKKVRASKLTATGESDIHHPNLWYYKLISFLGNDRTNEPADASDPLECHEDSIECIDIPQAEIVLEIPPLKRTVPSKSFHSGVKKKKADTIDRVQTFVQPLHYSEPKYKVQKVKNIESFYRKNEETERGKMSVFALYVGEKLEQIPTFQRTVAEKLISEVLFLAKTGHLNYDSKVETPSKKNSGAPEYTIMLTSPTETEVEEDEPSEQRTLLKELLTDGKQE